MNYLLWNKKKKKKQLWNEKNKNSTDKGLISKYTNNSYNSTTNKTNNPIEKWAKRSSCRGLVVNEPDWYPRGRGFHPWSCSVGWRSRIAVDVDVASGYSSDSTPSLGTSICYRCGPKKKKKKKKSQKKKKENICEALRLKCYMIFYFGPHVQIYETYLCIYMSREIQMQLWT